MFSPPISFVPEVDFKLFHSMDRKLYTILVINLCRDPVEALHIVALFLWLERTTLNNIVTKILSLPNVLINELADEAVACLNCINHGIFVASSDGYDIPLMQNIMNKDVTLPYFYENRLVATQGVIKVVNNVCIRALSDIMQVAIERNAAQSLADSQKLKPHSFRQPRISPSAGLMTPSAGFVTSDSGFMIPSYGFMTPGSGFFPMGHTPGELVRTPGGMVQTPSGMAHSGNQQSAIPADDRTIFVTFSKGYPVSEWEVRDFFLTNYGDCVESLHMQEVVPPEQALFARVVFRSVSAINYVLDGLAKAKFNINGKHVWARKFVPKRPRSSLPPLPPTAGSSRP